MQKEITPLLQQFDVHPLRGFLPESDPLQRLPDLFSPWEELIAELSALINAGIIRQNIEQLPLIETKTLRSQAEQERAMLLLCFFGHAYIWGQEETVQYLPEAIAVPWTEVAKKLGRPPILTHSSVIIQNWRRIDPEGPIATDNLATLHQFHGGIDESWFYLLTVEIEQIGAKAMVLTVEALLMAEKQEKEALKQLLKQLNTAIRAMTDCLKRMYKHCDPYIFYKRVRPFLASFDAIDYRGTAKPSAKSFHGASAAQSALFQALDAALEIPHPQSQSNYFLETMRAYMPPKHAAFVQMLAERSQIRSFCSSKRGLKSVYNDCVMAVDAFRKEHLKIVGLYVVAQAKKEIGPGALGTGGTNPIHFLREVEGDTKQQLL